VISHGSTNRCHAYPNYIDIINLNPVYFNKNYHNANIQIDVVDVVKRIALTGERMLLNMSSIKSKA
jgi:hypothetical protein